MTAEFLDRISKLSPKRLALLALELQNKVDSLEQARHEPLAVIGLACRFPGAHDAEEFWRLQRDGVDAISEVPKERWDIDSLYDPDPDAPGKIATRFGGFLSEVDRFDPAFFGISPREALSLDPQQRLLLEVSWEALEDAGQSPEKLFGHRTGVFVGIASNDYPQMLAGLDPSVLDTYLSTGGAHSIASGRISYVLGLHGPSLSIDTACSSSLVAIHLACQSLRMGESRMALAGGVNLILSPDISIMLSRAHMMAPDGRCKTFSAAADGFVRGEGCGVVVLKRLKDALADQDRVLAVIRGSAANQDGRSSGITAPNGPAQEDVIRQALANASVAPADLQYVETHGTGTSLGDPIEVQALGAALREGRTKPVGIGSVKTNIGHLEAAAGVAGLIKLVLALQHEEIPPHLHFHTPSVHIPWDELNVEVITQRRPWPAALGPRLAAVSSFGFSGTNVHVVVEGPPATAPRQNEVERPLHLVALSGRTEKALAEAAGRFERYLADHPNVPLADVAFTAGVGRSHFARRLALTAASMAEAREKVAGWGKGETVAGVSAGQARGSLEVAFLFTGQGAQYAGMGGALLETQPTFRKALARCDEILRPLLEQPLLSVLYPAKGTGPVATSPLDDTAYTQPALFALEYALAELWRSWGIEPAVLMGHSVGEYVAACLAGVFSLEDGLRLIAERGRLMGALPRNGAMAAVFAGEERVRSAVARRASHVSVAAVNGPESVVVSGEQAAVGEVLRELESEGIKSKRLTVSHAFHSPLMDPMLAAFAEVARTVSFAAPRIALVSNLTGRLAVPEEIAKAEYWVRHVREAVRFAEGMRTLYAKGHRVFLETGPAPTLLGMGQRCLPDGEGTWLPSLRPGREDWGVMLESLGRLHVLGAAVDWAGFDRDYGRSRVALPTYPFERERYWHAGIEGPRRAGRTTMVADAHPTDAWLYETEWRSKALATSAGAAESAETSKAGPARGTWLILADRGGVGRALAQRLGNAGGTCTLVDHGTGGGAAEAGRLDDLARVVREAGEALRGVVDLWALDVPGGDSLATDDVTAAEALACQGALHLVQALVQVAPRSLSGVWIVTRSAQAGAGLQAAPLAVSQATLWGLGKVVALEHPELHCVRVDLGPESDAEASTLAAEILFGDGEDQVALRASGRRVARLVRTPPAALGGAKLALRADGTYLVTGGLSGIGLQVAGFLVARGARHLVLMARRPPSAAARQAIEEWTRAGAEVVTAQGDVSREGELAAVLEGMGREHPPLRGVFHSAGLVADGVLVQQDWERFAKVFAPKVEGAWNLHRATREMSLDFFVLFSSGASLLGSPGQGNYAAANAFLDALAHHRRALGLPALSINWGAWAEVGVAADRGLGSRLALRGMDGIPPREGLEALGRGMRRGSAQIGVLNVDWERLGAHLPVALPFYADLCGPVGSGTRGRDTTTGRDLRLRLEEAPPSKRWTILRDHVAAEGARVLGLDPRKALETDRPLQELGLDSLMAVELRNALGKSVGGTLSATLLFDFPTIEKLTDHLGREVLGLDLVTRDAPPPDAASEAAAGQAEAALEALSDREMAALLSERLDHLESGGKAQG